MDQTRTKRMVDTALIATLALSGLGASIPTARGDEVSNLAITAAEENDAYGPFSVFRSEGTPSDNIDENLSNEGVAMPSEEGPSNLQDDSEEGEETEEPLVVFASSSVTVGTAKELKAALASENVNEIVLTDDIQSIKDQLVIDHDVVLNLNKKLLTFTDGGVLLVSNGNVEVRNGSLYTHTTTDTGGAIVQTGGTLTLAGGLDVLSFEINGIVTQGDSTLIIDDASITCNSERHAAINAQGSSKVTGENVDLHIRSNAKAVSQTDGANVTIKLGEFFIDNESLVSPYLANGYKLVSNTSGLYKSKGDIEGVLAEITLNPDSYTYDGTRKMPAVTVTFDGEDVTKECSVTYGNNREIGYGTVNVRAHATSDIICGEVTKSFPITSDSSDPDSGSDPEPDSNPDSGSESVTPTETVSVSSLAGLKEALANKHVKEIVLLADIQSVKDKLTINRDVVLNLNKNLLTFTDGGLLLVSNGNVEVRNGSLYTHTTTDTDGAIVQTGGTLTLAGGLDVLSYEINGIVTQGDSKLIVDDASITCNSERHAAINAQGNSKVTGENVDLHIRSNAKAVSKSGNANVIIKLGEFFINDASLVSPYLASGYKLVSNTSGLYKSKGDIESSLATITVNPDTYTYDGESKEPTVTVTFDGKDVTEDCSITYKNNKNPGTATVNIRAMATSDKITGETTRDFKIEQGTIDGSNADISLATTSYTYNGSKHEPHVTVKVNGSTVLSTNYTVTYSNNIDAGTATATVTFKSDSGYTGTVSENFTINQKEATVTPNSKSKRAGESDPELTATVTGTVGSDKLSYKLSRNSGESTGTYTITASGSSSQGNYKVTFKTGTFTITGSNSTNSTTTTSSTTSNNSKSNGNTTSSTNTTKSNGSTPAPNTNTSASAASTGSDRATNSTGATSSTGTTGTTGAATATRAASTGTIAPVAKTPATADPSFVGFGTLVSSALAALGIGFGTRKHSEE